MKDTLLINLYEPKTLEDMVLNPKTRKTLESLTRSNLSFILHGPPGCGKGTFTNILLSQDDGDPCLVKQKNLNVDYIRDTVTHYCDSAGGMEYITGQKTKHVVLNEAEKLHPDAQIMLRELIEKHAEHIRFIFMCNKLSKIDDAIQSRCPPVTFGPPTEPDMVKHLKKILDAENIEMEDPKLWKLVRRHKPDIRKIIMELQNICLQF